MAIFNPANSGAALFVGSAEKAGHKVSVLLLVCRVQGAADIETAISDLGKQSGGGLIVPPIPLRQCITSRPRATAFPLFTPVDFSLTRAACSHTGSMCFISTAKQRIDLLGRTPRYARETCSFSRSAGATAGSGSDDGLPVFEDDQCGRRLVKRSR
jgi:hypothetical protein